MKVRLAQLVVTKDVQENLKKIFSVIDSSNPGEWVVFPEGVISGYYPEDDDFLKKLDHKEIGRGIDQLRELAREKDINIIFGTAFQDGDDWYNTAQFINKKGELKIYKKVNLSTLDRKRFVPGDELEVFEADGVKFALQLCRDNAFPEQWKVLKRRGAQIVFHVNNAIAVGDDMRKHLLIARAFENQFFVVSVNNADKPATLPSLAISAFGEILYETKPQVEEIGVVEIDPEDVGTSYLEQERRDLVDLDIKN